MAEKLASGLIATGLKEGDNVAILGPNMPEWFLLVKLTTNPLELFYVKEVLNLVLETVMYRTPEQPTYFLLLQYQHCLVGSLDQVCPNLHSLFLSALLSGNSTCILN